jgi:hypothetical protein
MMIETIVARRDTIERSLATALAAKSPGFYNYKKVEVFTDRGSKPNMTKWQVEQNIIISKIRSLL